MKRIRAYLNRHYYPLALAGLSYNALVALCQYNWHSFFGWGLAAYYLWQIRKQERRHLQQWFANLSELITVLLKTKKP